MKGKNNKSTSAPPIVITNASSGQFSIARYSGGCRFNGTLYLYKPIHDILVREDWDRVYESLFYNEFIEAVKTGVKPELAKKPRNNKRNADYGKSLFDTI